MNKMQSLLNILLFSIILLSTACIQGAGSGRRGLIKDFSVTTNKTITGCGSTKFIEFSADKKSYSCLAACDVSTHIATTTEVNTFTASAEEVALKLFEESKALCLADSSAARPTGEVFIGTNFCSCLNGKSDIINDCDNYCANITSTNAPILHVDTTLGPSITNNTKLGNLNNWCNTQLDGDVGTPQCTLSAWDGDNYTDISTLTIAKSGNSFTADISSLSYNKTYVVKLVESKTGSNASSTEFQIRRVRPSSSTDTNGALKISPISQYTCLNYGGIADTNGTITRTSYVKAFYLYPANETPAPIPPSGGTNQSQIVCHDETNNPGSDNSLYPRLELIPAHFTLWDKTEPRFVKTNNVMAINATIASRLFDEYGVTSTVDIFTPVTYYNRPPLAGSVSTITEGFMMVPYINTTTNKAYCPTSVNYNSTDTMFRVLKDYMGDTEGLFLGEKDPDTIQDGNNGYKTVYGTMFVTETILKNYGFYIQNGLKIKATADLLHNKTIYYYWPVNTTMDPLQQGDRRLFTVRYFDQLSGNSPTGLSNTVRPSDKRIGCVPKTTTL